MGATQKLSAAARAVSIAACALAAAAWVSVRRSGETAPGGAANAGWLTGGEAANR